MNKEAGRKIIAEKVEDFEKNVLVLKKKGHGETNIRSNYIDVFFEALGWNMKSHYDVVREFSQRDTSGTKKVDYAFKINGKLKFFVEAKEASIDLVNDKDSIYQAKRYAYSTNGKAPIVILTDFEEFRVFNVLKAPDYNNTDRELLKKHCFEYAGYIENWDFIWDTFSKEAVAAGSLDALRGKIDKNTKTMDADFLEQITKWREDLARNIAIRNKDLSVDELNEAVQRILDRLLFIRNLEDREIEPENTLLDKTKKAENIYKSLIPIFNNLDNVYNGLLFKKHFSEDLAIDDKTIKDIIKSMCYPVSPFQFDVIEPEILGRIYEKFLGSKIRLTENHQAKIEEKIEVRKAGGVYYTPEYIVHYIVENTVGKKLNPQTPGGGSDTSDTTKPLSPEEIKKIKIVDPACGSGSFLLGAYSYLLDYHAKWYAAHKTDKAYKNDYYITKDGEVKVNLEKRGDILRNNIFGVDIDKEATEVAIMSLYLKMLDDGFDKGERDLFFIKGHVLPDMTANVKWGNSLIGTDYFDGRLDFDIQEMKEIKPFDWEKKFPEVFKRPSPTSTGSAQHPAHLPEGEGSSGGGFDCVIGNPPYVNIVNIDDIRIRNYLMNEYKTAKNKSDLYSFFAEKSIEILKHKGCLGFIFSNSWLSTNSFSKFREYLINKTKIYELVKLPSGVFKDATVTPILIFLTKENCKSNLITLKNYNNETFTEINYGLDYQRIINSPEYCFSFKPELKININTIKLGDIADFSLGIKTSSDELFVLNNKKDDNSYKLLRGKDISKYSYEWDEKWIWYRPDLMAKRNGARPRILSNFLSEEKILIKDISKDICATIDTNKYLVTDTVNFIFKITNYSMKFILGLLNSKFIKYWFMINFEAGLHIKNNQLQAIPIPNNVEKEIHDSLVSLVDQMLQTQKEFHNSKSESDKKLYEQKINILDEKIDALVYKLYGLTQEEIKIVEGEK